MAGDLSGLSERRHERREYKSWLEVAILDDSMKCVQAIRSPTADVSNGGCGLMTADEYAVGTEVLMRFSAPDENRTPMIRWGVVRHCRRVSKNGWYKVGFQFLERDVQPVDGFDWVEEQQAIDPDVLDGRDAA